MAAAPRLRELIPSPRQLVSRRQRHCSSVTRCSSLQVPCCLRCRLQAYTYVAVWIALSGAVIMYNKYLLAYRGFPYPITLTMWCVCMRLG